MSEQSRTKVKSEESRRIICKTFHYLKKEFQFMKEHNHDSCDLTPLSNVSQRVSEATGISKRTLSRFLREERTISTNSDKNGKKRKQSRRLKKPYLDITSRIANAIRSTMHSVIQGDVPTWDTLKTTFNETIGFEGSNTTLREILISMGYRWLLGNDDKRTVIEKHDVQIRRYRYLKDIMKYRETMPIVYTGARLVYRDPESGTCYTVLCAGTQNGYLRKTVWIYAAPGTIDLQYNISYNVYNTWLLTYLLPNLLGKSVVVVSDVHFNNKQCVIPTEKENLKKWLKKYNIPFDEDLPRIELLDIVVRNKDKFAAYKTDELICQSGHIVLRLPPVHPELNAVEVVFENFKTEIKLAIENSNFASHWAMVNSVVDKIKYTVWNESCEIVKRVELEYLGYYDIDTQVTIQIQQDELEQLEDRNNSDCSESD